jgi:FkbM family methyltransferase
VDDLLSGTQALPAERDRLYPDLLPMPPAGPSKSGLLTRINRKLLYTCLRRLKPEERNAIFPDVLEEFAESTRYQHRIPFLSGALRNLRNQHFCPSFVVDIGAYRGEWTRTAASIFPDAQILMVEANPEQTPYLIETVSALGGRAQYVQQLLGPEAKQSVTFYQLQTGTGSSVLEELTSFARKPITMPMDTLDHLMAPAPHSLPLLIKLDVQGFELEILKGAANTLQKAEVVVVETALLPYNKGAPSFAEVVAFMHEAGFSAYDLTDMLRRQTDSVLFMLDVMFVKTISTLREHRKFWLNEP